MSGAAARTSKIVKKKMKRNNRGRKGVMKVTTKSHEKQAINKDIYRTHRVIIDNRRIIFIIIY